MLRPVLQYPDPTLAKISEPVAEINDDIRALAQDLLDTLTTVGGVGIAAPQIGVLKRVVVIDVSQEKNDPDLPQDSGCSSIPWSRCLIPKAMRKTKAAFPCPICAPR